MKETNLSIVFGALVCIVTLYVANLILSRLVWSPIARIPGPKLAAATFWYEFYYDVVLPGQYTWKIRDLHKQYGPIIRINPYEVHIYDPEYYDQIYVGSSVRKTNKWAWPLEGFGTPHSILTAVDHNQHRKQRSMFSSKFSTIAVQRRESLLKEKVAKLMERFDQVERTGEPISLHHAYSALTIDIVTVFTFTESWNHLDAPDFAPAFMNMVEKVSLPTHLNKQFPFLIPTVKTLPLWLTTRLFGSQQARIDCTNIFARQVKTIKEKRAKSLADGKPRAQLSPEEAAFRSVFETMLDADVPDYLKSDSVLVDEALVLVFAGGGTTAHALEIMTFHMVSRPAALKCLEDELASAVAKHGVKHVGELPLPTLNALPYLTAVVREALRLSYGTPQRLQRVSPDVALQYGEYTLPPGTPVSMSALHIHEDERFFPNPMTFLPERWLPLETTGQKLSKYLVTFSRGSRQCVAMSLAMAELYLTAAAQFGSGRKMKLYDTDYERDIKTVMDGFAPMPSFQSKALRVTFEKR